MIPKIIHQTWKDENIQPELKEWTDTWLKQHPSWEYKLWTDQENREFIEKSFPSFLSIYDAYPYNIQRADAVRYFILLKYGGVYVDLDFECLKPIEELLENQECVLCLEPAKHSSNHRLEKIISNAFMASIPNHSFFKEVIEELNLAYNKFQNRGSKSYYILDTTGPFMFNRVFDNYKSKDQLSIISSKYFCPLTIREIREIVTNELNEDIESKLEDAYAIHYFMGSWWKEIST